MCFYVPEHYQPYIGFYFYNQTCDRGLHRLTLMKGKENIDNRKKTMNSVKCKRA